MEKIREYFNSRFGDFNIPFPEKDFLDKKQGIIKQKSGWMIHYIFGIEDNKNYMEYYASHRMTDDRHYKIFEDGVVNHLESIKSSFSYSKDSTKEEIKEIKIKYFEENQRIIKELKLKGLWITQQ